MKYQLTKIIIPLALALLLSAGAAGVIQVVVQNGSTEVKIDTTIETKSSVQYADEAVMPEISDVEALEGVEKGQGEIKVDGEVIPTVEAVESSGPVTENEETECPEGEECGRGAVYPSIDVSNPQVFANATLGQCIDVDGYFGSQCWDSMSAFFYNYAGRVLQTCGTGAAKGTIADGCWQKNAGNEFTMIWNPQDIQPGDIAVYSTGQWGHIGMAMGTYNNGYFTLLGQNQGGVACPGGGSAGNIINLSTRDFIGAFRPNAYIKPAPKPEPAPAPAPAPTPAPAVDTCKVRTVRKGETLGSIMKECLGKIEWGEAMNEYARHWHSTKANPGKTVFYGWTHGTGYGLFAGDVIEYRADQ